MLGSRLYEMRCACGWSQVEVAKRLSVSKQTVSNWENENIQPSVEMLVKIAKLFQVSTDYLLGLNDTPILHVEDLPIEFIAHLALLVEDYRAMIRKNH